MWRIVITSKTASFRPHFLVKKQPSLPVPPPSTIHGIVSAALGKNINLNEFAYRFKFQGRGDDLQTIYQVSKENKIKKVNILVRGMLIDNTLELFIEDDKIANTMLNPRYPPLLGRGEDLAKIESVERVDVKFKDGFIASPNSITTDLDADGELTIMPTSFDYSKSPRLGKYSQFKIITRPTQVNRTGIEYNGTVVEWLKF